MSKGVEFSAAVAKSVEAMYLTPDVVGQRAEILALAHLRPDERVIDVGVGPGLLAADAALLVGAHGRVVGVDPSEAMVTMARTRCAALPQAEIAVGDAVRLDYPEASFDVGFSIQVLEYVPDVMAALKQLYRVIRPGGRVVLMDTDWDSLVWHSTERQLMDKVRTCWDDHLEDPHLPATLAAQLRRAGFHLSHVKVVPMMSVGFQPHSYAGGMLKAIHGFVKANGERHGLAPADVQTWYDDQLRLAERGEFFFSVNRYAFVASR